MVDPARPLNRRQALARALLISLAIAWLTGAIGHWGQWYSPEPYYRAQVQAFFEGRLALSHAPEGLSHDLAWIDGGTQQVWGLGAPLWMSLWEAIGRAIHLTPFPDRLSMLFGIVLVTYALLRAWSGPGGDRSAASRGAFLFTALLPGVLTMLRGQVLVYEEAAAYAYGTAMLLLAGTIMMIRRPSTPCYVLLLGFAGATGLVRPTVWFYGLATAAIATVLYVHRRGSLRRALGPVVLAAGLFLAGGGALYLTNYVRFGSGAEFGHLLNLEDLPGNMYATRFGYPFATAPLAAATRELAGGMFGRPELAQRREFYDKAIHAGQADIPRWREYYFTTYSWVYAPIALAGLGCGIIAWSRVRRRAEHAPRGSDLDRDTRWLAAWAVLGGAPLIVFYLHSPSVSSRYFLDIAPMIAVLIAIAWRHAATAIGRVGFAGIAFAGLAVWWAVSAVGFRVRRSWLSPIGSTAAYAAMMKVVDPLPGARPLPPGAYDLADPWLAGYIGGDQWWCRCFVDAYREAACDHAGLAQGADVERVPGDRPHMVAHRIDPVPVCTSVRPWPACSVAGSEAPLVDIADADMLDAERPAIETAIVPPALYGNGTSWDLTTGAVGVATYLFADDPAYVEVEVAPSGHRPAGPDFAPAVRAKIELEELRLVATASTIRGVRFRFAGPRTERYRSGLQVIFLAFGPPDRIDQPVSEYTLLRVAWRDQHEVER
jgi:hypothetical protein